ncbi:MAG: PilN domain-containing protein [Gammaproteobacteria bacterium]
MGLQLAQQVNLFQSEFHIRYDIVCARNVQMLLIVIVALLSAVSVYDYFRERSQNNYLVELQSQHTELEVQLQNTKQTAPSMIVDSNLKQRVTGFKRDVELKQQVLDALSGQSFGNTSGFSRFFKGLAKQNVAGLWLTSFKITNGGKDIGISGSAYQPELVPDFLSNLSAETIFQGTNFQTFQVKREENPTRVDFYIDTQFVDAMP